MSDNDHGNDNDMASTSSASLPLPAITLTTTASSNPRTTSIHPLPLSRQVSLNSSATSAVVGMAGGTAAVFPRRLVSSSSSTSGSSTMRGHHGMATTTRVSTSNSVSSSSGQRPVLEVDVVAVLKEIAQENPDMSAPIAAIKALLELIKHSRATTTMSEFIETLRYASHVLKDSSRHPISVSAGCDLFMRFVTVTSHDHTEFETCKEYLLQSGNLVVEKASSQKQRIVDFSLDFIRDGCTILVHSYSRVVLQLLITAATRQNKRFTVYATESRPSNSGYRMAECLRRAGAGIPVTVVLDSAVGYIMGKVDFVLVGAEGVVENGGLINQIGTYQIAIVAKASRKPFYAAAESFKFLRMYPLDQYDLPHQKHSTLNYLPPMDLSASENVSNASAKNVAANDGSTGEAATQMGNGVSDRIVATPLSLPSSSEVAAGSSGAVPPAVDYTPPEYITLLLTDLGVLTPSGVSDELIKLYY